ncbi:MAG: PD40 domain-containing protein [Chloroflexi bacterium]|nr:PD40 domain-containing protein [Chloroflexota bacterium]
MSQQSPNSQIEDLIRDGIAKARAGDKATARELLQKAVQLDEYNERAWFWLASVVETDEERRTCLHNVVLINPNNTRAQEMLDRLDETSSGEPPPKAPINPRKALIGAIIALVIIFVACIIFLVSSGGGGDKEAKATPSITPTASATASATPNPTATATATLEPTWTPTPTVSPTVDLAASMPTPPPDMQGRIVMRSGNEALDRENQPIFFVNLADLSRVRASANNVRGRNPSVSPDSTRYVFIQYLSGTQDIALTVSNLTGSETRTVSQYWGGASIIVFGQDMPAWSPVAPQIAFIGKESGNRSTDLYIVTIGDTPPVEGGNPELLRRLTSDDSAESWPSWSPDGSRIIYVADVIDDTLARPNGIDLYIINVSDGTISPVTSDVNALVETQPDWSPDGARVVFSGTVAGANTSDIYIVPLDGLAPPSVLVDLGPHDTQPRWSPDGRYIVFNSDYLGGIGTDVYIYDLETQTTYAVTNDPRSQDEANDWAR